jgi:hypothetical protein
LPRRRSRHPIDRTPKSTAVGSSRSRRRLTSASRANDTEVGRPLVCPLRILLMQVEADAAPRRLLPWRGALASRHQRAIVRARRHHRAAVQPTRDAARALRPAALAPRRGTPNCGAQSSDSWESCILTLELASCSRCRPPRLVSALGRKSTFSVIIEVDLSLFA